jgi:ABC-2 type transporter
MDQEQYWARNPSEYHYHSTKKLVEIFQFTHNNRMVHSGLQKQGNNRDTINASPKLVKTRRISKWEIFRACLSRELLLLKRNSPLHIFKTIQISFIAFVMTTLFLRTRMNHQTVMDGNIYLGALFMGIMIVNFNGMTELAMTTKRLPIFYKQRELLNLPGWAVLSSVFLLSIPVSLLETSIWIGLTYFGIGFAPSPTR